MITRNWMTFGLALALTVPGRAQDNRKVSANASRKPNVVFILVDNVGWGDFGVYGGATCSTR